MAQLAFLSGVYWLNFAILIGFGCIDFISAMYFYLFLTFFVYPVGRLFYNLLFDDRLQFEQPFLGVLKILLAMPIIALINFLFGINHVSNGGLLLISYLHIIHSNGKLLRKDTFTPKLLPAARRRGSSLKINHIFVILFSACFTIISINSFKIYNFFPDHVTVVPYPSDASHYYAIISSLLRHTGNFIHGYRISLFGGVNMSAFSSLLEIFESVFIKFSGSDIVLFHSVNFSLFLILLLFCVSFVPVFERGALSKTEFNNPWNSIFLGLVVIVLFSYPRLKCALLQYGIIAWHGYLSWLYVLSAMIICFSAKHLLKKGIDVRCYMTLAFLLCLAALLLHTVYAGILVFSFLAYLFYDRLTRRGRVYFTSIWAFTIIGSIVLLASVFKDHPFVFGELRISIHDFYVNKAEIHYYFHDLFFLKPIYKFISAFLLSDSVIANVTGSIYALFCFVGYFLVIPVHYFIAPKSKFKFYFVNILLGIIIFSLLINYLISVRPSVLAMYMPNVALIAVTLMAIESILANDYFQFQKERVLLKAAIALSLAGIALCFSYSTFAVPRERLDIDRNLYDVIEYVKGSAPPNSTILHNVESSSHYAYFSGFAYRNTVMERRAYAYVSYRGWKEIKDDVNKFFEDNNADARLAILDKYHVTHILSSPDHPIDLRGKNFKVVLSKDKYKLYEYLK